MMLVATQTEMNQLAELLVSKYKKQFSLTNNPCCCDIVINFKNSPSISFDGSGSYENPIIANLKVSQVPGNALIINSDGGYVPNFASSAIKTPIPVTGANFASALNWTGANSSGVTIASTYTLQIFWNDANRYLVPGEWTRTATGFNIINNGTSISGFDATGPNINDIFFVHISP